MISHYVICSPYFFSILMHICFLINLSICVSKRVSLIRELFDMYGIYRYKQEIVLYI